MTDSEESCLVIYFNNDEILYQGGSLHQGFNFLWTYATIWQLKYFVKLLLSVCVSSELSGLLFIHSYLLYVTIYFIYITSYFVLSWETLSLCIESPWWNSIFYPKYLFIINILWKMFHLNTPLTANVCNAICSYSLCLYLP